MTIRVTRSRLFSASCLLAALFVALQMAVGVDPGQAASVTPASSSVTVNWAGNNGDLQQYQPSTRSADLPGGSLADSGKYDDFKNLKVTVSQTKNLIDQSVDVSFSGLAATTSATTPLGYGSSDYLQIMQCWGDDPNAADFYQTCAYGANTSEAGFAAAQANYSGTGIDVSTVGRGAIQVQDGTYLNPDKQRVPMSRVGYPFKSVFGDINHAQAALAGTVVNGVGSYFTPSSTNEQPVVYSINGKGEVLFSVQSSIRQPYLGCGAVDSTGKPRKCWLVVVPRGTHAGSFKDATAPYSTDPGSAGFDHSACADSVLVTSSDISTSPEGHGFGQSARYQAGSPLDPRCSFFGDRMVIPLDFQATTPACGAGAAERKTTGSELMAPALSTWQADLCGGNDGATFTLATTSTAATNVQLLGHQSEFAFTTGEIDPSGLGPDESAAFADATMRYAPVANTGLVIGFVDQTRYKSITNIKLSARLVAKLLTQSYLLQVPYVSGSLASAKNQHVANNAWSLSTDPEFKALNPGISLGTNFLMTAGPAGDSSFQQVWAWLQSDNNARAFLQGSPDPWGMKVNPYYLPSTNGAALGGGYPIDLSKVAVDSFPRADQTTAPDAASAATDYLGQSVDSTMMSPFSSSLSSIASRVFNSDTQQQNVWDPNKTNTAGQLGAWVSVSPGILGAGSGQQAMGLTDAAEANLYGISVASLQVPNTDNYVAPSQDSMTAALAAMRKSSKTSVAQMDFSALASNAYPLTETVYGMINVNSTGLDAGARSDYASFLRYAAADARGTSGLLRGDTPPGFVPLTAGQKAQALQVADQVVNPPPAGSSASSSADSPVTYISSDTSTNADSSSGDSASASSAAAGSSAGGTDGPQTSATGENLETTKTAARAGIASNSVGVALIVAFLGLAAAPILMHRKRGAL